MHLGPERPRPSRRVSQGVAALGLLLLLTSCGQTGSGDRAAQASSPSRAQSSSATVSPPHARAQSTLGPRVVTKMLVFVVENHSLSQMRSGMPFLYGLGQKYGYATRYHAITHPSLPNYLAMTGGSTYRVRDDRDPAAHKIRATSVFGQALSKGKTAKVYAESMPSNCATSNNGQYYVRHNPWTYHVGERRACRRRDVPLSTLAGDVAAGSLPNAGMVVPDACSDAHNCSLDTADAWLKKQVGLTMSGPDWTSGHLLIVVTADEDDHNENNSVLTVMAHPYLSGAMVDTALNHYSLARAYSEIDGAAPLAKARGATSLLSAFGLRAAP